MNTCIDLGCASWKKKGYIGLDINPSSNLDIIADAHSLPFRDKVVDAINIFNVFEHLYNPLICLSECNRILKLNRIIIIGIPNIMQIRRFLRWMIRGKISVSSGHIYGWCLPEIINLFKLKGFEYVNHYFNTDERHHKIKWIERIIANINNRIVDSNLNIVFIKIVELKDFK